MAVEQDQLDELMETAVQNHRSREEEEEFQALRDEWFSRSVEENLELLNGDSDVTGVYQFGYYKDGELPEEIPGMNQIVYQLDGDPNGGSYIGYESYEQTYKKVKDEYEKHVHDGTLTDEITNQYEEATSLYGEQKDAYADYRKEFPGSPDYLKEKNPVSSYLEYEKPRQAYAQFQEKEESEIAKDVSMEEVEEHLGKDEDVFVVSTEERHRLEKGESQVQPVSEDKVDERKPDKYVVKKGDELNTADIKGMQNYLSSHNLSFDEVDKEKDPDGYGESVVQQMQQVDKNLKENDSSYQSSLPENLKYYREGERPEGIPGMTLVVGKIEGAPGYYAGYESYDQTYSTSLAEADAESLSIEKEKSNGSTPQSELTERSDKNRDAYNNANEIYDFQKTQYLDYVKEHPGNDFLAKGDSVDSYQSYQNDVLKRQGADTIANVKEMLSKGWNNMVQVVDAVIKKIENYANHVGMGKEEAKENILDKSVELAQSPDKESQNVFQDILNQNSQRQDYVSAYDMAKSSGDKVYQGLTGVGMIDELNRGEDFSAQKLMNSLDAVKMDEQVSEKGSRDKKIEQVQTEIPTDAKEGLKTMGDRMAQVADIASGPSGGKAAMLASLTDQLEAGASKDDSWDYEKG